MKWKQRWLSGLQGSRHAQMRARICVLTRLHMCACSQAAHKEAAESRTVAKHAQMELDEQALTRTITFARICVFTRANMQAHMQAQM